MARHALNIARLRKLVLLVLVLAIGTIAGLYLFGRAGKEPIRRVDEGDVSRAGQGTTLIGEDFDYTFTERERPIFRIRGDSIRADRNETIFLDGVGLTLYDDSGRGYQAESREASFNRTSNEGRLQGNVVLKGPGGLELRTAQLNINQKGVVLVSPKPVEIRYAGQYVANADRMRVHTKDELFQLTGHTRIRSLPGAEIPLAVTSERAVYERKEKLLRVEGNAEIRRGREHVKAQRLTVYLTPDEKSLGFLRALWNVSGRIDGSADDPNMAVIRFSGRDLAIQMEPGAENQPRRIVLEGGEVNRAMMETAGAGLTRTLNALQIEGNMARGVFTAAEAFGGIEMREAVRGAKANRRVSAKRTQAEFRPDGQLARLTLFNEIDFRDGDVRANGTRANLDLDAGRGEFFGSPVQASSPRGRMTAPRVLYNTEHQIMNAMGGVRAVLEQTGDTNLAGSPLGEGEGPVWVESREAFWRQAPSSFLFRGDVRAWRGENLMLTSELRGDKEEDRLNASGGVKTLWVPAKGTAAAPARAAGKGEPAASRAPVEVTAQELVYREGAGVLVYTGNVRVVQEGKTLQGQRLEVQMNEDKEAKVMICTGDVKVDDPKAGRHIEGQKAVYDLALRRMEITGDKVSLRDRDGNRVQGRRVLYFVDDGKVEVKGKDETAAPAGTAPGRG